MKAGAAVTAAAAGAGADLTVAHSTIADNVGGGVVAADWYGGVSLDHALLSGNTSGDDLEVILSEDDNAVQGRRGAGNQALSSPAAA